MEDDDQGDYSSVDKIEEQFTKYTDIQKKQWGGQRRNQEGKNGLEGGDQGGGQ